VQKFFNDTGIDGHGSNVTSHDDDPPPALALKKKPSRGGGAVASVQRQG